MSLKRTAKWKRTVQTKYQCHLTEAFVIYRNQCSESKKYLKVTRDCGISEKGGYGRDEEGKKEALQY